MGFNMIAHQQLGSEGPLVSVLGLGCMGFSGNYGPADPAESVSTIEAALEMGVNFLDTGDFYGAGDNEMLVAKAIANRRDQAFISLKFGALSTPGGGINGFDARPHALKNFLAYSLKRLGTDYVDLYQPARIDPNVPIEETVGAIKDLIEAGYVRYLGLSEAGPDSIAKAHAVHPVTALQTEYSLATRDVETTTLATLSKRGVGLVAYGVLSRGLLGGDLTASRAWPRSDFRQHAPRFQKDNLAGNVKRVDRLRAIAAEAGLTPASLSIGYVRSRAPQCVALLGTRRKDRLAEAVAAIDKPVADDVMRAVDMAFPQGGFAGDRYAPAHMAMVDR